MAKIGLTRRSVVMGASGAAVTMAVDRPARAAGSKITFLTNWFAQAEQGGFYQAKATGIYEKAGLDVDIVMGGTQVNTMQLLTGGSADIIIGHDIQVLKAIENGLPVVTIGTAFQFDLQGIMTHPDVKSLAGLKGHTILIATLSHTTFWPWLKQKFGFTDDMIGVDTFNLQPFLHDPTVAMQGIPSSEPYEAMRLGVPVNFFLFGDDGYPPYGSGMVTTDDFIAHRPADAAAFVRCSLEGWRDYFRDPAPANKLILEANAMMSEGRIAFAIEKMKEMHVLDRGEAATQGIGTMTAARWQQTRDFLVQFGLLSSSVDSNKAFTARFTDGLHITA